MPSLLVFATLLLCSTAEEIQQVPSLMHEGQATAFSVASYGSFGPVGVDTNIPFSQVELNINNRWSGATNSFSAPMDGFFLFSASIGSALGTACTASIVLTTSLDTRRVATLSTSTSGPTGGSNQITLSLALNDQVSVQLHPDGGSTFSSPDEILVTFSGLQLSNPGATPLDGVSPFHEGDPVGFSVRSTADFGPVTQLTNIPFPTIEVSEGIEGWNPTTSQFRVPVDGLYLFTLSLGSIDGQSCAASIVHSTLTGSRRVSSVKTANEGEKGDSNFVLLSLVSGDYVSAQLHADGGVAHSAADHVLSTFTGIMMSNPGATP